MGTHRIEINENAEIRELTHEADGKQVGTGKFGVKDKDGNMVPLSTEVGETDMLVLPHDHNVKKKLDLSPKSADGKPAELKKPIGLENHGDSVELGCDHVTLGVMGCVTVKTTAYDLSGMHFNNDNTINMRGKSDRFDDALGPLPGGQQYTYGLESDHSIIALPFGRVDFTDAGSDPKNPAKLLTIDGNDKADITAGRVETMKSAAAVPVIEALKEEKDPAKKAQKAEERAKTFKTVGLPDDVAAKLTPGDYTAFADPNAKRGIPAAEKESDEEKTKRENFLRTLSMAKAAMEGTAVASVENASQQQAAANEPLPFSQHHIDQLIGKYDNFNIQNVAEMQEKLIAQGKMQRVENHDARYPSETPGGLAGDVLGPALS